MAYRVGDEVNGHRLGSDNQWHLVKSSAGRPSSSPAGRSASSSQGTGAPGSSSPTGSSSGSPRPWYAHWWVIATALVVVVAALVGVALVRRGEDLVASASSVNRPTATASPSAAPAAPTVPAASPPVATRAPTASAAPAPVPTVPPRASTAPAAPTTAPPVAAARGLNTAVRDGAFEFTVTGVTCGQSQVGSEYLNKAAQGQFCLVSMTLANVGSTSQVFDSAFQKGLDSQGRALQADAEAAWYIEESKSFLEPIVAGTKVQGTIVFDVAKTSSLAELHLHESASSSGATVTVS